MAIKIKIRTVITYKDKEKWICDKLNEHSTPTSFIKDLLADLFNGKLVYTNTNNNINTNEKKSDILLSEMDCIFK